VGACECDGVCVVVCEGSGCSHVSGADEGVGVEVGEIQLGGYTWKMRVMRCCSR
jgi:hypothetical protein